MKFKGLAKCALDAFFVPFDLQIKWNYEESLHHVITCNCYSTEDAFSALRITNLNQQILHVSNLSREVL